MDKKIILLIVAAVCIALYFYGQQAKNSEYTQYLPIVGGLAFGLNTLINLATDSPNRIPLPRYVK